MDDLKLPEPSPPRLRVAIETMAGERWELHFGKSFVIGRSESCEVRIQDEHVSRQHAEVVFEQGEWRVRDLDSSNGIFIEGRRVDSSAVARALTLRLGIYGPLVSLEAQEARRDKPAVHENAATLDRYAQHYFGKSEGGEPAGEHTAFVRMAYSRVQSRQRRKYGQVIVALVALVFGVAAYAVYQRRQIAQQKSTAENLFYSMKALDLNIANVERLVSNSHNEPAADSVRKDQSQRKEMENSYDRYLATLHVYDPKMTEQERLKLRIARIFGECELAMPREFATRIDDYIKKWQSSGRLAKAIRTAKENGYAEKIAQELLAQDLPPEFFYLALQESSFDPYASGPPTRKGIAKGMWQFIPETAGKYGLRIGPLADRRWPDPGDDRHHFELETKAAARYLKDLYCTEAQASGFLVMASYNWGEDRVLPLIRAMPPNPRERNFWRLLTADGDKIPQETYDYVFYIASAAVIGQNPRLYGFDFENPLAHLESK